MQIGVIKNDEGRTVREHLTDDYNRHFSGELLCKVGLNCYRPLKARSVSKQTHIRLPVNRPPPAFTAACEAGEQRPVRSLMQSAPLPVQNGVGACFRLLLSLKRGCGEQLLAWSAWTLRAHFRLMSAA